MRPINHDKDRRRLIRAMAATGLLAGFENLLPAYARAATGRPRHLTEAAARVVGGPPRDVTMDFHIRREGIDIAGGHASSAYTNNHSIPGPLLELWEGKNALLRIHNHIPDEITSIHWHGFLMPFQMDGVPGVTFPGIDPGETFEAHFPVRQYGTYWYHSHASTQEQNCQTGPVVIHPADPADRVPADREYVIVLNDWTFEDPHRVLAKLKEMGDYYNYSMRTASDFVEDVKKAGWKATLNDRLGWDRMRMSPRDIADVTGHTYTYLMNGLHPAANWTALFKPGERVKLRVINASAMTYFNFRVPGLPMTVVSADGQNVEPVETDEFQIGVAERFDVIVEPKDDTAYTLMAESMDRSGYARGTLAPCMGMAAAVPALREQPQRTMVDMGMNMQEMGMSHLPAPRHGKDRMGGMDHDMKPLAHDVGAGPDAMGTGAMMEKAGPVVAQQKGENPIHLHGQFMELENEQGEYLPFKDTISVLPSSRVSLLMTADEPGRWFFHCHLLYHLEMGMARVVVTSDQPENDNA